MQSLRFLTCLSAICICLTSFGQKKSTAKIKFGDVKPADFAPAVYSVDSNANAVVLADIGNTKFEGNNDGGLSLNFNHIKRLRLMNKNGFDEATIQIPVYFSGTSEERITNFEAATYNIENGKVVVTKLDKASIFKDKYDKNHSIQKFTFPNIKEGSIIEYKYNLISPFYFNLQPWQFQASLPRLWSEYQVTIPNDIFDYVLMRHGYLPYVIDTTSFSTEMYSLLDPGGLQASQTATITSSTITAHWAMQDVPALKNESFVTDIDNYLSRIEFQLRRIKYSATHVEEYMGNWNQLVERLMKDEDFGLPITQSNGWLNDDLKKITAGAANDLDKAKKWYNYLRDNFTCTKDDGKYLTKTLKKTFQDKNGAVADINLLLLVGLKNLGLDATAAILSTRDNGKANELYPLINEYNYVIVRLKINDNSYTLDASTKMIGFGKLPDELYNGSARLIADIPVLVPLSSDSLHESKVTSVFIMNDENAKALSGSFSSTLGQQEAINFRERLSKQSKDDYFKEKKKAFTFETNITDGQLDSLTIPEAPLVIKYSFSLTPNDEDIIYFSPLLTEAYKENPFKSAERKYPVEMPYCSDETYILNMEVPKGYKVEELPKSARVKLNDNEGMFEYIIGQNGDRVQLRCRTTINKANFDPDDYETLRNFFGFIVKKQAEQIVFKKN